MLLLPFYRWESGGLARLNNLLKITQMISARVRIQSVCLQSHFSLYLVTKLSTELNVFFNRNFKMYGKDYLIQQFFEDIAPSWVIHIHKECDICSYNASDWSSVVFLQVVLFCSRILWVYLAVESSTKQDLTIEDWISHSPSMENSNTDGKLKKGDWKGFNEWTIHKRLDRVKRSQQGMVKITQD